MSRQASKTLIGAFVMGAVVLIVFGLIVFGSGRFFTKTYTYAMYFEGSVKGLTVGAPVVFRGVKIGSVTDIVLLTNSKEMTVQIPVYVQVMHDRFKEVEVTPGARQAEDPEKTIKMLIERGLRAQLELQNFVTAQLMVALDFHPDTPARLVGVDKAYPEIPTIPSPLQALARTVISLPIESLFNNLSASLSGIDKLVNSPKLAQSIQTLNLAMADARKLILNIDSRVEPIAVSIEETLTDTQHLVRRIDNKIDPLEKGISESEKDFHQLLMVIQSRVKQLAKSMENTSKSANTALTQAEKTLKTIEGITKEDSPLIYELTQTLQQLSAAARSIRIWADYLERHPEALLRGKGGNIRR